MKKDYEYLQEDYDEEQLYEHHEAQQARGLRQPQQPTPQQIAEHNLTHLPYRNWCPICVQGKGRQDNYKKQQSRQPIIQVDFAYIKSQQDTRTTPVLTAVDVTTQLCMAILVPDKPSMMDYMVNSLQAFILECGRTQGILQSDNEDTLNALLKATAAKVGSMTVRHSPSYSSNSQGSVERLHRTLLGQIRVVKAQVESNYSITMPTKHCLLPWIVRHAAWTVNRYVIHSDGYTSFERRWGRNYERAICEFGETLLYLPPQHKQLPKADLRMQKCIWLGKVSETGENYVATEQGVLKARTVRRLQPDFKYDLALLNKVSGTPWAPRGNIYNPSFATLLDTQLHPKQTTQDAGQQTNVADDIVAEPATKQQRTTSPPQLPSTSASTSRPLPDSPRATSPTGRQHPPLPAPPPRQQLRRMTPEEVMQPTKAQKTSKDTTIRSTEETTKEPQPLRQRINAVTLSNGTSITSYTNDDTTEDQPIIFDNEGYDETQLREGMRHESGQMKLHDVYDEVSTSNVDDTILREATPTKWVHRKKGTGVRSRIVAKGYTEKTEDEDSVYASTPMFTTLRTLLALQMSRPNWVARLGDVSTAFLHAPIAKDNEGKQRDIYLWPPRELCPDYAAHPKLGKTTWLKYYRSLAS